MLDKTHKTHGFVDAVESNTSYMYPVNILQA